MIKSRLLANELIKYASSADIAAGMVGAVSDDRSAVVGKNNWCYIYKGSNDYRNSYINGTVCGLWAISGRVYLKLVRMLVTN